MNDQRVYKFESGYTIALKRSWSPTLYQVAIESYTDQNPPPEPPYKTMKIKQKDGQIERHIPQYDDEQYQAGFNLYSASLLRYQLKLLYTMAIDPSSIDANLVAEGRRFAEAAGASLPEDDVKAYLRLITTPAENDEESELAKFHKWITDPTSSNLPGASLIDYFRQTVGAQIPGQSDLQSGPGTRAGMATQNGRPAVADAASSIADTLSSGAVGQFE